MGELIDLSGRTFGYWTVLNKNEEDTLKYKRAYWNCICKCGNMKSVNGKNLRRGTSLSCGCLQKENQRYEDLTGKKYGKLTVLCKSEEKIGNRISWKCLCDCGNEKIVPGYCLKCGSVKSCGCLKTDYNDLSGKKFGHITIIKRVQDRYKSNGRKSIRYECECECGKRIIKDYSNIFNNMDNINYSCGCLRRKSNKYEKVGDYYIGYTSNNKKFYFDCDDYELIKCFNWHIDKNGYVITKNNGKVIKMHRLILNTEPSDVVDHINHNTVDNRKCNIRNVSRSQNMQNKTPNNELNISGISFEKESSKWRAYISKNNKRIYLGRFTNLKDAIDARKQAEEKYFGEYSYDNSMSYSLKHTIE